MATATDTLFETQTPKNNNTRIFMTSSQFSVETAYRFHCLVGPNGRRRVETTCELMGFRRDRHVVRGLQTVQGGGDLIDMKSDVVESVAAVSG